MRWVCNDKGVIYPLVRIIHEIFGYIYRREGQGNRSSKTTKAHMIEAVSIHLSYRNKDKLINF